MAFSLISEGRRTIFGKKKETEDNNRRYEQYGTFGFSEYREREEHREKPGFQLITSTEPKRYPISSVNRTRLLLGFLVLLFLMILLVFRMGYWQIIKADDLKIMAASMQKVDTEIDSERGAIYDSKMNTLAETVTEYELYGYTQYMYKSQALTETERAVTVQNLAELTGEDEDVLISKLEGDDNLVLLAEGLTQEDVDKAEELWGGNIMVKTKVSRYYPNGAFAAQLLGNVNEENSGRVGLEYEYNSALAGVKGRTVKTTDSQGNTLANGSGKYYQAQDGYSIVTSVDSVIQHYVEDAIETGMERTGSMSITAIAMNPKTGEVLALAQTPEYDPNNPNVPSEEEARKDYNTLSDAEKSEYLSSMWKIEAVSSIYEPGSTYKLIAAASALDNGTADDNSRYYCGGTFNVGGTSLNCLDSHGTQNLAEAVGNSCNAALSTVALDMGAEKYYNYIDLFGFRDQTGIDLPGETYSIVKNPADMGSVDLATTGYGQGIAITPIQMLCAVNSLGNNGVLLKPRVVSRIIDSDGNTVEEFGTEEVRQVVSEETAEKMCEMMEYYVAEAGGDKAYVPGYRVGGKTGTANIASGGIYTSSKDCSFVAMAPMDDPQISILVICHKPTKTVYGNDSAGPIVAEILEKSLMYLGVEREYTESEAAKSEKNKISVPDVTGKDSQDAIDILTEKKLKYTVVPESKSEQTFVVVDQYPKEGAKVDKNSVVYLYSK